MGVSSGRQGLFGQLAAVTAANAAYILGVQLLALISLSGADYGAFSLQYLTLAFASAVTMSVLCDAYVRAEVSGRPTASWSDYSGVLVHLSVLSGLATLVLSVAVPLLRPVAVTGAVAVAATTYRIGARFRALRDRKPGSVVLADSGGFLVLVLAWVVLPGDWRHDLTGVTAIWAVSAMCTAVLSLTPVWRRPSVLGSWAHTYREEIRSLLPEAGLLYVGNIATPYTLAPLLGLTSFATYRASVSVAAPVRFILMPLRPVISGLRLARMRSATVMAANATVSVVLGAAAFGALTAVNRSTWELGVLNAASEFAAAIGVFVAATYLATFYYYAARTHVPGRPLVVARLVHTVLVTALPLGGVLVRDLDGAMWGLALGTVLSAFVWVVSVLGTSHDGRPDTGDDPALDSLT